MATKLGKIVADFSTQLATAISIGGTSLTLQSIVDDDGNNIPNGSYYFTIDGNNASKEHIFCTITGASVTSIVSVSRQGVETSGIVRAHRVGAQVVITDFAHILRMSELFQGVTRLDASVPLRYDGTATISNANDLATKAYVDGVAIAGAPDASTTVKGIVKMSVAPASATAPIAVGDNDNRVSPVSLASLTANIVAALAGSGSPSGANKFVTADTDALKELLSNKDTTTTLGTSDTKYPSQKAVKTYVDLRSKPIAVMTANLNYTNSASETDIIANTSVAGGSLSANRAIRFELNYQYNEVSNNNTLVKIYYGGTFTTFTLVRTNGTGTVYGTLICTIAFVSAGNQYIGGSALGIRSASSAVTGTGQTGTLTIDESAAQNVRMTVTTNGGATENFIANAATIHLI